MAEQTIAVQFATRQPKRRVRDPERPAAEPVERPFGAPITVMQAAFDGAQPDEVVINGVRYVPEENAAIAVHTFDNREIIRIIYSRP